MARQLKRWESPRKEGRNNKGKGGSARQRQRRKQMQALRKKLKEQSDLFDQGKPPRFPFLLSAIAPFTFAKRDIPVLHTDNSSCVYYRHHSQELQR